MTLQTSMPSLLEQRQGMQLPKHTSYQVSFQDFLIYFPTPLPGYNTHDRQHTRSTTHTIDNTHDRYALCLTSQVISTRNPIRGEYLLLGLFTVTILVRRPTSVLSQRPHTLCSRCSRAYAGNVVLGFPVRTRSRWIEGSSG